MLLGAIDARRIRSSDSALVSFGTRNLAWVLRYVANQKEHHGRGTTVARLERCTGQEEATDKEEATV